MSWRRALKISESTGGGRAAAVLFALLVAAPHTAVSQAGPAVDSPPRSVVAERLSRLADGLREVTGAPGLAVAVATSDGVHVISSGLAVVEHGVAVDENVRFRLASTSKAVTAVLLASLWDRGVIDLDRAAGDYLPELPAHVATVTPRQLAGHLAGIRGYVAGDTIHDTRHFGGPREALAIFVSDPLRSPPGEVYGYSTFGYTLLAAVMEAATGERLDVLLRGTLAAPLGLESLAIDDPRRIVTGRTGFYERALTGAIGRAPYVDPSYKVAGAGILASAGDLARFGHALLGDRLLSDSARAVLFEPQRTATGEETGVALGWRIGRDPFGRRVWHHEGSMAGARSALLVYPGRDMAVALLSNLSTTPFFAFESAAALAAAATSPAGGPCLQSAAGGWQGTAALDGLPTEAALRIEPEGRSVGGVLKLGESPLPIAREVPILDGWCGEHGPVLLLGLGPNWGLLPVPLSKTGNELAALVELQGGHSLELRVER